MKSTIAAIDFGTCKIVTLVAETSGTQRCDIIGAGIAAYDGFLDGEWNNTVMLNEAIQKSITEAETQSKRKIREINVGVPGEFTRVYAVETSVTIQGADPHVTPRHVEKIFANADKQLSPVRGVVVHRSPAWFMVDGGKKTLEPVGLKGTEPKALVSFVVADTFFLDDVMARLRDMNITVSGFFSSSTGEAMLYLLEEDRDRTAILIDIGYLCTDVMAVEGDAVQLRILQLAVAKAGVGFVGGDVVTGAEVAHGLDSLRAQKLHAALEVRLGAPLALLRRREAEAACLYGTPHRRPGDAKAVEAVGVHVGDSGNNLPVLAPDVEVAAR